MADKAETFAVLEGEYDGSPVVAMICTDLKNYMGKRATPWFLGLSTPLSKPTVQGLPTAEEAEELNRWEDALDREIKSQSTSFFVGRVTWQANRELLYYVSKPDPIVGEIQKLIDRRTTRPFAFRYEQDPDWKNVNLYTKLLQH